MNRPQYPRSSSNDNVHYAPLKEDAEKEAVSMPKALLDMWKRVEKSNMHFQSLWGMSTGLQELDALTGGLKPGQLAVIAGRPHMGKSALARLLLRHAAVNQGKGVVLYCLEDRVETACRKIIRDQAKVDHWRFHQKRLLADEESALMLASDKLAEANIFLDDTPGLTISEISRRIRKLKADQDISLCLVDPLPLQLHRVTPLESEIADINKATARLKGLRSLARELDMAIVATSSVKQAEPRTDNRPCLCDLYHAREIERVADTIILIHRPEYYNPDDSPGIAELIIVKQPELPNAIAIVPYEQKQFLFGQIEHITDTWNFFSKNHDVFQEP